MTADLDRRLRAALAREDADVLVEVGCDLADAGRQDDALVCFERAVALGEDWVWFNVGNTLRDLGRPDGAVDAYRRALVAGETDAWLNLGDVLEALGDQPGAAHAFGAAGEVGQPEGHLHLAQLLHEQGEHEQAQVAVAAAVACGFLPAVAQQACWRWHSTGDLAAEPGLRAGAAVSGSARADLAELLVATGRRSEALAQLELGAKLGQRECWLPLGNLLAGDDLPDADADADAADDADGDGAHAERRHRAAPVVDEVAAEEAYRAGIAAGDDWCHHNLAVLLIGRGDLLGAEEHLVAGAAAGDELALAALQRLRGGA